MLLAPFRASLVPAPRRRGTGLCLILCLASSRSLPSQFLPSSPYLTGKSRILPDVSARARAPPALHWERGVGSSTLFIQFIHPLLGAQ